MISSKMKTHREKYEENNEQLVRVVAKLRKKVANLERRLIEENRFAQNQHDENVVLKIKLTEKENYAHMMQSSAIELISHNTMQMQNFLVKTGLKIPSRHQKQANVQIIRKEPHISMKKEPECEKGTIQQHHNEKPKSHPNKPVRLDLCYYSNNFNIRSIFSGSIESFRKIGRPNIVIFKQIVIAVR